MFLQLLKKRVLLLIFIGFLLLALTACQRGDDGVSPSVSSTNESGQVELFKPLASLAPNPVGPNLALTATASADSSLPSSSYLPALAIDDNRSSQWRSAVGYVTHWLRLEWAFPVTIGHLYIRSGSMFYLLSQTISSIKYLDLNSNLWVTIPGSYFIYGGHSPALVGYIDFNFPPVTTRAITVFLNSNPPNDGGQSGSVNIGEIEAYSGATGSLKIASPTTGDLFAYGESISFIGSQPGAVTNIEWVDNGGVPFAQGLSTSRSDLSPGTHTITLRGSSDGNTTSDSITISVIKSIKIKDMETGLSPAEPFKMSSIRGIKKFQAIGCLDDEGKIEFKPVKVDWSLPDGNLDSAHTMKGKILDLLDSNKGKIGVLVTQNSTATELLATDTATFVSYFSGNITLKAEFRNEKSPPTISKSLSIGLKQPTFSVKVWPVGDRPVPLFEQWKTATKQVWEKENILQIETIQLGNKIENVIAPNEPLNPFPLLIPTAESFLNRSLGEKVSFLNPIMFDELLNSNYGSKGILPRQPFVLFSQKRDQNSINVYPVDIVRTYKLFPIGFEPPQGGFAADSEIPYYNFDDQNLISDKLKSGIAIRNFQTSSPQTRRYFPHEIGHILIRFRDEHKIDGVSQKVPSNNVMTGDPGGDGFEVEAAQFIKILNLDKTKTSPTIFITEK